MSQPITRHSSRVTPSYTVLGVRVHAAQIPDVLRTIERWIEQLQRTVMRPGSTGSICSDSFTVNCKSRKRLGRGLLSKELENPKPERT